MTLPDDTPEWSAHAGAPAALARCPNCRRTWLAPPLQRLFGCPACGEPWPGQVSLGLSHAAALDEREQVRAELNAAGFGLPGAGRLLESGWTLRYALPGGAVQLRGDAAGVTLHLEGQRRERTLHLPRAPEVGLLARVQDAARLLRDQNRFDHPDPPGGRRVDVTSHIEVVYVRNDPVAERVLNLHLAGARWDSSLTPGGAARLLATYHEQAQLHGGEALGQLVTLAMRAERRLRDTGAVLVVSRLGADVHTCQDRQAS